MAEDSTPAKDDPNRDEKGYFLEGNDAALKHGLQAELNRIDADTLTNIIQPVAESYIDQLRQEQAYDGRSDDGVYRWKKKKCYELALLDHQIGRALGVITADVDEYLDKTKPHSILDSHMKTREKIQMNLGLLDDSPQDKKAQAQTGFFEAMSEDSSSKDE